MAPLVDCFLRTHEELNFIQVTIKPGMVTCIIIPALKK